MVSRGYSGDIEKSFKSDSKKLCSIESENTHWHATWHRHCYMPTTTEAGKGKTERGRPANRTAESGKKLQIQNKKEI